MAIETRFTKLLEIDLPIVQAPMAGVSTPEMAAAVSNGGGLGSISVGAANAEKARDAIAATRQITNAAFNVNLFAHDPARANPAREAAWLAMLRPQFAEFDAEPPSALNEIYRSIKDDDEMLEALIELAPPVVSFHFGLPSAERIGKLRSRGIVLFASATTVEEARAVEDAGVDVVVAQGWEAGGHRGIFDPDEDRMIGTMALVPQVVDAVSIPVVAAGGITDGRGIAAALVLGADAVQLGTAFIGADESSAPEAYRSMLASPRGTRTAVTNAISGRAARGIENRFMIEYRDGPDLVPDYPIAYDAGKALAAAASGAGNSDFSAMWAGQAAALCKFEPSGAILARLTEETQRALGRFGTS